MRRVRTSERTGATYRANFSALAPHVVSGARRYRSDVRRASCPPIIFACSFAPLVNSVPQKDLALCDAFHLEEQKLFCATVCSNSKSAFVCAGAPFQRVIPQAASLGMGWKAEAEPAAAAFIGSIFRDSLVDLAAIAQ